MTRNAWLAADAEPGWLQALAPVERQIDTLRERLREEASAGRCPV